MAMSQSEQNALVQQNKALAERIAQLEAAKPTPGSLACKIGEKGGLSVYGLQRFPITLYAEQWERLIENIPQIKAFMLANSSKLTRKDHSAYRKPVAAVEPAQSAETTAAVAVANRILGAQ